MRKHKYGAVRTKVGDITFASKKEARRYQELKLLEKAGEIAGLELQPRIPLRVEGTLVCTLVPDFVYFDKLAGRRIFEDSKGVVTPIFRLKTKLLAALMPNVILRVT